MRTLALRVVRPDGGPARVVPMDEQTVGVESAVGGEQAELALQLGPRGAVACSGVECVLCPERAKGEHAVEVGPVGIDEVPESSFCGSVVLVYALPQHVHCLCVLLLARLLMQPDKRISGGEPVHGELERRSRVGEDAQQRVCRGSDVARYSRGRDIGGILGSNARERLLDETSLQRARGTVAAGVETLVARDYGVGHLDGEWV